MIKTKKRLGFTVIEMLVVIIVIAILVTAIMLAYGAMIDKSEATACLANRKTIQKAYQFYRLDTPQPKSLDIFLKNENGIANIWLDSKISCPAKGIYSASSDIVICSIHNKSGGGGLPEGSFYIPGTGNAIIGSGKWTDAISTATVVNFTQGDKFEVDGKYYVAVSTEVNEWRGTKTSPKMEDPAVVNGSAWTTKSGGGLVELTGDSYDWGALVNGTYTFIRGDILLYNGHYYVCKVQGYTGSAPITKQNSGWMKTPDNDLAYWYDITPTP